MRKHISHILDRTPIHLGFRFLHIRIGKLTGKFADLKQVHADRVHVVLIFQKDIKLPTEAGKRFFNPIAVLQNVRQDLPVAVRKAHTAAPDPFADFRGRLRLCCT